MTPKKPARTTTTTVTTVVEQSRVTDEESRVVRMRRGLTVPQDRPLELKHTETAAAREALLAIEREMVMKLRARAAELQARKAKIVSSMKGTPKRK
jgi:DNA-directed RNA polymerase sigma subunit (sigma70/sigma32)